ncbi:MAG: hypothetical protein LBV02_07020, partial [Bacteroidales bacterium]|nr:hypothetical protein [Bacteroidales bacterium]
MKKTIFIVTVLFFLVLAAGAQNNYKHSVGIMAGNFSGVSYKFLHKKFAFQCDAGWKYMFTSHQYMISYQDIFSQENKEVQFFTFEINPNIMFQKNFKDQPSFIF